MATRTSKAFAAYVKTLEEEMPDCTPSIILFNALVDVLRYSEEQAVDFKEELQDARDHNAHNPTDRA